MMTDKPRCEAYTGLGRRCSNTSAQTVTGQRVKDAHVCAMHNLRYVATPLRLTDDRQLVRDGPGYTHHEITWLMIYPLKVEPAPDPLPPNCPTCGQYIAKAKRRLLVSVADDC